MEDSLNSGLTLERKFIVPENKTEPHPRFHFSVKPPYPLSYRTRETLKDGSQILTRPIHPEDAPLLLELFHRLSEETIYFRFLTNLKSLPPELLRDFTNIDYDQSVAMVALRDSELGKSILGVCRIMRTAGSKRGEIAIVVDDAWQGKGIGSILMRRAMNTAKELGIEEVWGSASPRNKRIFLIAEKIGFSIKSSPERGLFQIEMRFPPEA
jgi:acetyltransferase